MELRNAAPLRSTLAPRARFALAQAVLGYHTQRGVKNELFSLLAVEDKGSSVEGTGEQDGGKEDGEPLPSGPRCHPQHTIAGAIISQLQRVSSYTPHELLDDTARYPLVAYIMTLASTDAYRRRGIASRLLSSCLAHAHSNRKCGAVYLHVITYNVAAIAFYSKHGFVRVGTLMDYYFIDGR